MDLSTKWKLFSHLAITLIGFGLTRNLLSFSNLSFGVGLSKMKSETSQGYFMDRNRLQANAEGSWHWTQVQASYRCHFKRQLELYQWSPQKQSAPIITRLFIEEKKNLIRDTPWRAMACLWGWVSRCQVFWEFKVYSMCNCNNCSAYETPCHIGLL